MNNKCWHHIISNTVMWASMSLAIITAINITGRISVLWFFVIPFIVTVTKRKEKEDG